MLNSIRVSWRATSAGGCEMMDRADLLAALAADSGASGHTGERASHSDLVPSVNRRWVEKQG